MTASKRKSPRGVVAKSDSPSTLASQKCLLRSTKRNTIVRMRRAQLGPTTKLTKNQNGTVKKKSPSQPQRKSQRMNLFMNSCKEIEQNSPPTNKDEYVFDENDVSSTTRSKKVIKKPRTAKKRPKVNSSTRKKNKNQANYLRKSPRNIGLISMKPQITSTPVTTDKDSKPSKNTNNKERMNYPNDNVSGSVLQKNTGSEKNYLKRKSNSTPVLNQFKGVESSVFIPSPKKLLRLLAKDTSTPSGNIKAPAVSKNYDMRLGLDESVSLLFSPVEKVFSPSSEYCSMEDTLSQVSSHEVHIPKPVFEEETEHDVQMNKSVNVKTYTGSATKPKIKRTKGRYSVSKVDAWAEKVNSQFDEIEKFELSIED